MVHLVIEDWFSSSFFYNLCAEHFLIVVLQFQSILHIYVLKAVRNLRFLYFYCEIEGMSNKVLWLDILLVLIEFAG